MQVLGEGKPENQNHAMIFCFGECLQTVDMNQDNRIAEALKMRNLLMEFEPRAEAPRAHPNLPPKDFRAQVVKTAKREPITALVGFREWIFSGKVRARCSPCALVPVWQSLCACVDAQLAGSKAPAHCTCTLHESPAHCTLRLHLQTRVLCTCT